ncbi:MAG: hypothetical protein ACM337_06185 [Syntrophaceae bacterium]
MSTLAEISCYSIILCLLLGVVKRFGTFFNEWKWGGHLTDFVELMVMWAVYVWLSNLFDSRITYLDESDAINLLAIFLVCISVALFGGKNDHSILP